MRLITFANEIVSASAGSETITAISGRGFMLLSEVAPRIGVSVDNGIRFPVKPYVLYNLKVATSLTLHWDAYLSTITGLTNIASNTLPTILLFDKEVVDNILYCETANVGSVVSRKEFQFTHVLSAGGSAESLAINLHESVLGATVTVVSNETPAANTTAALGHYTAAVYQTAFLDTAGDGAASADIRGENSMQLSYTPHAVNDTTFTFYISLQF